MVLENMKNLPRAIVPLVEAVRNAEDMLARASVRLQNPNNILGASSDFIRAEERRNNAANALWRTIVGEKEIAIEADQRLYLSLTLWANQEAIRIREQFAGW
jgi:hypothetical protein